MHAGKELKYLQSRMLAVSDESAADLLLEKGTT
jgi:hypothetical protein